MRRIKRNRAKCLYCGDVIESFFTHDFKFCKCGKLAVDGGKEYLRRMSDNLDMVEELNEYEEE